MGPDGYQNSSIIGPDAYQNSSVKGPYAYITSYDTDTVAVVDTRTNNVTNIVDTETFTNKDIWERGDLPHGVAITPDGAEVYVTNAGSGTVSVIDTATNNLTAVVDVEGYPRGVAVNPIGTKVYVASDRRDYNSQLVTHGIISVIDTSTKNVTATIKVGVSPYGVAVSPDGTEVYVANRNSGTISIVDTITNKFKATIPVGNGYTYSYSDSDDGPTGVAVSPDGKKLYVTRDEYSNSGVFVIDTVTQTATATVKVGDAPYGVAVNPAGTKVYVTNTNSGTVSVIDTATNTVTATVNVGHSPYGVSVTPDGTKVYVTNYGDNNVSVLDTTTNTVIATVNAGSRPYSFGQFIGPAPAQQALPVAHFSSNVTAGNAPLSIQFNDRSENAISVNWDFGDGKNSTERNPVNEFINSGTYTVNLTATNGNSTSSKLATITVSESIEPIGNESAENVQSIFPVVDGSIRDGLYSPKDGVADVTMDNSVVQSLDVERDDKPFEDRGIIEFDISTISGPVTNATLNVSVFSSNGPYPFKVDILAYNGDGNLDLNDFNSGTLFRTFEYNGEKSIQLDVTEVLQNMVSSGAKYAAFNFQYAEPSTIPMNGPCVAFNSLEYPPAAKLTIVSETFNEKTVPILPVANFTGNVTKGYVPLTVQFNDSSENATAWSWDFENDGIIDSIDRNPVYEYAVPGNYTVNLTVADENGIDSTFAMITALEKPVAHWEYSPQEPVSGDILYINGSAFPGKKVDVLATFEKTVPVSKGKFEYIIKDVKIPEGFNNFFTVEASGARNLNVRVKMLIWVTKSSEASGSTAVVSQSSVPPGTYKIKIDGNAEKGVSEVNLKMSASQGVKVDSNGNFNYSYSTTAIPPGNFKVKVGDITKEIKIKSERTKKPEPVLPVANFSSNVTQSFVPLTVQFTDLSKNTTGLNWNFGDGITSTEQNPAHTYPVAGNYTVNLTAINQNGTSSKLATILVLEKPVLPVADFSFNTTPNSDSFEVQFTDLSKNATGWNWDFGDGNISKEQNPVHTYYKNLYEEICYATLTVTNENGTDSTFRGVSVGVPGLVC